LDPTPDNSTVGRDQLVGRRTGPGPWQQATRALLSPKPAGLGLLAALISAVVEAIPTAVIPNPFFVRMTPVRPLDYVFLVASSVLIGVVFSTFGLPKAPVSCQNRTVGSGLLSALAIGCPICNHVVVALIGISGALTIWAPLQPLLGAIAVLILLWTLRQRLAGIGPRLVAA
jgi:hypothetical protein